MIVKTISNILVNKDTDETHSTMQLYDNIGYFERFSEYKNGKLNEFLLLKFRDNREDLRLIINDNNQDVYNNVFVMNDKGETIERLI